MRFENHNAYPLCRNRKEQVACVGETMRRLGEGCTENDIKTSLGITSAQLNDVADEARVYAVIRSTSRGRAYNPVARAA